MAERAAARPWAFGLAPAVLTGLAALADIVLILGWLAGDLSATAVLGCHLALVAAVAGAARLVCREAPSEGLVRVVLLLLFGPFGGPVLMIAAPGPAATDTALRGTPRPRGARPRDAADRLHDQIRQGRRHPLPQIAAPAFLDRLAGGTLDQQQQAIAAISRSYHPDMRPALMAALASPVPALRVQAAAVFARLRGSYGAQAKALLARPDAPAQALRDVAASGFVDADTCALLRAALLRSEEDRAAQMSGAATAAFRPALLEAPRLRRYACGGVG
ncbi:hypothetical protein [Paracoccus liaowanqingii]|uniref:hypothetical protein n=1 Tax=Paracoccus liaowanqingii TaxID=2560053 RepID=UPI00159BAFE8|nr:hypothetical protein [Paracoccus liaowanqingii]